MMEVVLLLSTLSSSPIVPQLSKEVLEEMDRLLATTFSTDGHNLLFTLLDNGGGLNRIALVYAARKVVAELLMKWLNRGTAV